MLNCWTFCDAHVRQATRVEDWKACFLWSLGFRCVPLISIWSKLPPQGSRPGSHLSSHDLRDTSPPCFKRSQFAERWMTLASVGLPIIVPAVQRALGLSPHHELLPGPGSRVSFQQLRLQAQRLWIEQIPPNKVIWLGFNVPRPCVLLQMCSVPTRPQPATITPNWHNCVLEHRPGYPPRWYPKVSSWSR